MSKEQVKAILDRVLIWPPERTQRRFWCSWSRRTRASIG